MTAQLPVLCLMPFFLFINYLGQIISPRPSLLAEALFLVFADGRKETSAIGLRLTAIFKMHAPCVVR